MIDYHSELALCMKYQYPNDDVTSICIEVEKGLYIGFLKIRIPKDIIRGGNLKVVNKND